MNNIFKSFCGTEYFFYDISAHRLTTVTKKGANVAVSIKYGEAAKILYYQFDRDMQRGIPHEQREFDPCTLGEFIQVYNQVVLMLKTDLESFNYHLTTKSILAQ